MGYDSESDPLVNMYPSGPWVTFKSDWTQYTGFKPTRGSAERLFIPNPHPNTLLQTHEGFG